MQIVDKLIIAVLKASEITASCSVTVTYSTQISSLLTTTNTCDAQKHLTMNFYYSVYVRGICTVYCVLLLNKQVISPDCCCKNLAGCKDREIDGLRAVIFLFCDKRWFMRALFFAFCRICWFNITHEQRNISDRTERRPTLFRDNMTLKCLSRLQW